MSNKKYNFNVDTCLWVNYRAAYPTKKLLVKFGHVVEHGGGVLGRFDDNAHALKVLNEAGYTADELEVK